MKYTKALLGLALAGLIAGQAHAAVRYLGNTADADLTTTIDLSTNPTATLGGTYDTATRTWTWDGADTYVLEEIVFVTNGTLVIPAGAVVRGQPRTDGSTFNPGALVIARTAKLIADGTAEQPIIFTTASTTGAATGGRASGASPAFWDAAPATTPQPNATAGVWGGLVVLGNAPTNVDRDATGIPELFGVHNTTKTVTTDDRASVEGIPTPSAANTAGFDRYGGINADDNSGVIRYVSIRHGGANLSANNELNGLTLGGVGRGTTVDYVEIWGNTDDGIEIFGGNVNATHLAVINAQDDGIDLDVGYSGTLQFVFVLAGVNTDKLGEWDGSYENEGTINGFATANPVSVTRQPVAAFTVANATLLGNLAATGGTFNHSLHIRDQAAPRVFNSILVNSRANGIEVDNRATVAPALTTTAGFTQKLAFLKGFTAFHTTGAFTDVAGWVGGGSADTAVEGVLDDAEFVNFFNANPGFAKVPSASEGNLANGVAINPVPGSTTATAGSFDAVFDDILLGSNDAIQVVPYRGAFDTDLTADLWTTGWTAAERANVIVAKGNGAN